MNVDKKKLFAVTLVVSLIAALTFFYFDKIKSPSFKYFHFSCSIFSRDHQLVWKSKPGYDYCIYKSDGSYFASHTAVDELTYFDVHDEVIWKAKENAHHQLKLSKNEEKLLVISAEIIEYQKERVKADCFSVRDLKNKILHQWCLKDHLNEIEQMKVPVSKRQIPMASRSIAINVENEISHGNSFYEIEQNVLSASQPAFQAGNYIANLGHVGLVLIFDSKLEKILWSMHSWRRFESPVHDVQVTPAGELLFYVNMIPLKEGGFYSSLVSIDPLDQKTKWEFLAHPVQNFSSRILGGVQQLKDGHYLYSDLTRGGQAFEITSSGRRVWEFTNPTLSSITQELLEFQEAKVFDNYGFFKARAISYEE